MDKWPLLIRSYRKENGLKQDALADLLHVDQTTVSRWERGIDTPSLAMQKRLRDIMWTREDSALDIALRMTRTAFSRASIVAPGTKIVEVSQPQAQHFETTPSDMRGRLMRDFYGSDYYEAYMEPLGALGIYSGEVTRIDLITKTNRSQADEQYSHTTITPMLTASGIFAVSQSRSVSEEFAQTQPRRQIYRFDELID